ncbi:MAG TPA: GNAT family N-acetyltransferase [Flavobacteriales bacterium]|nr:GNAT family N-acetyltransferase [Flavobacteriales bacterium]HQW87866.1 GNAT family N-acetyltransferase [Flavobacteriales bacterium]
MSTTVTWRALPFDALDVDTLYALLRLRTDVFVVEQNCPYPELDDRDQTALHVIGRDASGHVLAYARILPPDEDGMPAVGRVVVDSGQRGTGLGHALMREVLTVLQRTYGRIDSRMSAQAHLEGFYAAHGYARHGDVFDLDGIPHIAMRLSAPA